MQTNTITMLAGCFGLTELGFGNNAVEMQTTATYDAATQEFIIHTPTTLAQKYCECRIRERNHSLSSITNPLIRDHKRSRPRQLVRSVCTADDQGRQPWHPCLPGSNKVSSAVSIMMRVMLYTVITRRQQGLPPWQCFASLMCVLRNQDSSICQGVRIEDMGHKMGCNGVDNVSRGAGIPLAILNSILVFFWVLDAVPHLCN